MIYHHHIPKTGGTAINFAFFRLSGVSPERVYRMVNDAALGLTVNAGGLVYTRNTPASWQETPWYAFSHEPPLALQLPEEAVRFTVLRDPVERVVSQYRGLTMRLEQGRARELHKFMGGSYREFLRRLPEVHLRAQLLAWSPDRDPRQAIDNLRLSCQTFWTYPEMESGVDRLRRLLERRRPEERHLWRALRLEPANVSICAWRPSELDLEATRQAVGSASIEFYRRAEECA